MTDAIEIIHHDHVNLDGFLNVLETAVDGLAPDQPKPNLEPLYSAAYYIRVFPDRCHHPKEERYLFGAVRARSTVRSARTALRCSAKTWKLGFGRFSKKSRVNLKTVFFDW
jgi:hemerythrin-like domain-containing protein